MCLFRPGGRGGRCLRVDGVTGVHSYLTAAQLEPLRAFLPSRGRGRPAGQTPRVEQASPLYARLSVTDRARFEAVARARGYDDLGKWAVALMEAAAALDVPPGFGAAVAPGVYSNTLDRAPLSPEHVARAIEACDPSPGETPPEGQTRTLWHERGK
jgi:hypothetical protein